MHSGNNAYNDYAQSNAYVAPPRAPGADLPVLTAADVLKRRRESIEETMAANIAEAEYFEREAATHRQRAKDGGGLLASINEALAKLEA